MTDPTLLAPAAVLVAWTLVITVWLAVTRLPAFHAAGLTLGTLPTGGRYADLEPSMPTRVNWVSHNYTHLLEQPTLFYALSAILGIAGAGESALQWAWGYTVLRIAHSLWQIFVNVVAIRFLLFLGSNICLFVLCAEALQVTMGH